MQELYYRSWINTEKEKVHMIPIPPAKAELHRRITQDAFDDGGTATWMSGLKEKAVWRSVTDPRTGHTIHAVTDRPHAALTADLHKGLRIMSWMSNSTPLTWYWWDQPLVRILPAHTDPKRQHLNGGWAVPGVPEVHVYRREEAHKVLIHESIHALRLDVPMEAATAVRPLFEQNLGYRLWPHLGECYTEFFAEWLWAIADSKSAVDAKKRWAYQRQCSEGQAAQVWARIHDRTVDEDTNAFAYYVLKWVLMQHEQEVLLAPQQTVQKWFGWWLEARPRLTQMAAQVAHTESVAIPMGMTCGY